MALSAPMARLLAERKAREEPEPPARSRPDPLVEALKRAAPFIDAMPTPPGQWPASSLIIMGYFVTVTSPRPGAKDRAREYAAMHLAEARRRYKAGFYANPLGEPVLRDENRS